MIFHPHTRGQTGKLLSNSEQFLYAFLHCYLQVNHSQRLSEAPLKPWLTAKTNGTVLTAHCNCMAGLGEVCSHVGEILFAVEARVRMLKSRTCPLVPCQWIMPSAVTSVPYAELEDIDFTASSTKKRRLYQVISGVTDQPTPVKPWTVYGPIHTADQ